MKILDPRPLKMTGIKTRYTTGVPVNRSGGLRVNSLDGLSRAMWCQRQTHACLFHRNILPNTHSMVVQEQSEEGLCCAAGLREAGRGRGLQGSAPPAPVWLAQWHITTCKCSP